MKINEKQVEKWMVNPFIQGALVGCLIIIFHLFSFFGKAIGLTDPKPNSPYIISTAMLFFFVLFNSILSIKADNLIKYWGKSITTYMLILVAGGYLSFLISGVHIDDAGSFRWLFVVITMGYLIFLAIVQSMKKIVDIAIKQDKRLHNDE